MPFASQMERDIHFKKHGHKFGVASAEEYEKMADQFMIGSLNPNTRECARPNGADRLRFDLVTLHFGVASTSPNFIRTFYPVERRIVVRHGGPAAYFTYECGRTNL